MISDNRVFKCQFHQHSTSSFYARRSQKRKKDCQVKQFFVLSGSVCVKAAHRTLMKLTQCTYSTGKVPSFMQQFHKAGSLLRKREKQAGLSTTINKLLLHTFQSVGNFPPSRLSPSPSRHSTSWTCRRPSSSRRGSRSTRRPETFPKRPSRKGSSSNQTRLNQQGVNFTNKFLQQKARPFLHNRVCKMV